MTVDGVVVVNPVAGKGRAKSSWERHKDELYRRLGSAPEVVFTDDRGHATELARRFAREGVPWLASWGGDGLAHEIVTGLCRAWFEDGLEDSLPELLIVPAGTGNDYVRSLGIPTDPGEAVRLLSEGTARPVDVGRLNDRYLVNVGGVGFDAEVAASVNRVPRLLKQLGPRFGYVYGVFRALPGHTNRPLTVRTKDRTIRRTCFLVAFGVGSSVGGGMSILPGAEPDDGLLDVLVAGDLGKLEAVTLFQKIYSGDHVVHPKVEVFRTDRLRVDGPTDVPVHADGESLGTTPITVRCMVEVLNVYRPCASS